MAGQFNIVVFLFIRSISTTITGCMTIMEKERNARLYRALGELNPEYRQVMYLIYFEEMTVEEISHIMGKNKKQIYNLSDRGRKALREKLGDE